jgi:alpha-methylacyl-CoA racemase
VGPLTGIKVVEFAGIGPGPFAAMMLGDLGADVIRIDRAALAKNPAGPSSDVSNRSRRSIAIDLKHPDGVELALRLVERCDVLIEGFRPGIMERLGLGPEICLDRRPELVYGRVTGWGQTGPLSQSAGHDINYIALAGALYPIGRAGERPVPPLNLVGDFGGGGMLLAFGIVSALLAVQRGGTGQVVDAAMVDGAALLTTMIHSLKALGLWTDERGANMLDSGAHYYDVYETADGHYISIGAIEPQFYAELLSKVGADPAGLADQNNRQAWPEMSERFAALFAQRTRAEWEALLEGTDACFAPVLSLDEAPRHPHNVVRRTFVELEGVIQPAPAPRFSRDGLEDPTPPPRPGRDTDEILDELGFNPAKASRLRDSGVIA